MTPANPKPLRNDREMLTELCEALESCTLDSDPVTVHRSLHRWIRRIRAHLTRTPTDVTIAGYLSAHDEAPGEMRDAVPSPGEGPRCPVCAAPEVPASTPRTTYSCGTSDYDQRPGTLRVVCLPPTTGDVDVE
jgi:hypothetical protein